MMPILTTCVMCSQEMHIELMNRKSRIEKQLMEVSQSLSGMEVPNLEPTPFYFFLMNNLPLFSSQCFVLLIERV